MVEEEKMNDKKKFKVRFDDAYQANHVEKSRVEKEFFENALKNKRFQKSLHSQKTCDDLKDHILKLDDSPSKSREDDDLSSCPFNKGLKKSQTLITDSRVDGTFP